MRPDRERRIKELILAATPERVEELSRQPGTRPPAYGPEIIQGSTPWTDFDHYRERGYRLYCYQSLGPLELFKLPDIAFEKRVSLAVWYDLQAQQDAIIVQVTPDKLLKIPAETTHLAAFWVAHSNPPN